MFFKSMEEQQKDIVNSILCWPVYHGFDVLVCSPRRTGKTKIICDVLEDCVFNDILVVTPRGSAFREEIKKRTKRSNGITFATTDTSITGLNPEVVIVEEATCIKEDVLSCLIPFLNNCHVQVIMTMTPIIYNGKNPPLIKRIWDQHDCLKYQMSLDYSKEKEECKELFANDHWQTELEGNWVCK
jgi:hypothetical protein